MTYRNKQGFTIIELTLAMTFISILLLAIITLILQIGAVYTKGMTLREVDRAGQVISSDIQRELNQSGKNKGEVLSIGDTTGGRLCVGPTVYAWNYRDYLDDSVLAAFNRYEDGTTDIRFIKFSGDRTYCEEPVDPSSERLPVPTTARELLGESSSDIVLYSLVYQSPVAIDGEQTIYHVSLRIGTRSNSSGGSEGVIGCAPGGDVDESRCAINEFDFTARAGYKDEGGEV